MKTKYKAKYKQFEHFTSISSSEIAPKLYIFTTAISSLASLIHYYKCVRPGHLMRQCYISIEFEYINC